MKRFQYVFLFSVFLLASCGVKRSLEDRPNLAGLINIDTTRIKHNDSVYSIGKNSLVKNQFGIWELYVEGDALERGLVTGSLTRELMHKQERAIFDKIERRVPSKGHQKFLSKMVTFFNRKMHLHVLEEYKKEIYGISRFALEEYDTFAPPYVRALYLHGAHDIGHALQDLMLVGCTSFAAWDSKTADGQLLIGRNFDFYVNDDFAEEKIAAFINPSAGHKFMLYTWGGMMGVVSGANEKGLTVTINAGKSRIPLIAKTPISLVAREILQYAGTTEEAVEIAKKREVFVSEALMVGSAAERKAILIEVAPNNLGVYEVTNSNQLICSNHFQSEEYSNDRRNNKTRVESHSTYRFTRMQELLEGSEGIRPVDAAEILRNKEGLNDNAIGLGNEKAINQLLAHHGIIFKPEENKVWISSNPFQMGAFVAYDLDIAFENFMKDGKPKSVAINELTIPADNFIKTQAFNSYLEYRKLSEEIIARDYKVEENEIKQLINLNPFNWKSWALAGEYYYKLKDYKNAVIHFKQAQNREVTTLPDEKWLETKIRKSYRKF